jgi:hypothetical protein
VPKHGNTRLVPMRRIHNVLRLGMYFKRDKVNKSSRGYCGSNECMIISPLAFHHVCMSLLMNAIEFNVDAKLQKATSCKVK